MEFVLSNWWLFDKEWRNNHPYTFDEGTKGAYIGTLVGGWWLDENGEKIYEEEWSTI